MDQSADVFSLSAAVYDLLYSDKDTKAEALWIANTLERSGCPPQGSLLEFGSGTGRHARVLANQGYQVTGIEPSPSMLEHAEAHPLVTFLAGDTATTRLNQTFDAVLALFHVMSYHTSLVELSSFFETASVHLKPGGLFGFDVWYSPAVHSLTPERRVLERKNAGISVTRVATPDEDIDNSLVTVHYDYTVKDTTTGKTSSFTESHPMRHFSQTEINLMASQHGFEMVEAREFMTDNPPSRNTWGVWFTVRKV